MLAVYESIDLGLISMLRGPSTASSENDVLELLQANHPLLLRDPIHEDRVYVYHAFGVHALEFGELLQCLAIALRADDEEATSLCQTLEQSPFTHVTAMLNTFSIQRKWVPNFIFIQPILISVISQMLESCDCCMRTQ